MSHWKDLLVGSMNEITHNI